MTTNDDNDNTDQKNDNSDTNIIYLPIETSIGKNDVLYLPNNNDNDLIIFFCGDIQDTQNQMKLSNTFNKFGEYCLESVITILSLKFPNSSILIIRPAKNVDNFSIFCNFLPHVDNYGQSIPSYINGNGCKHLIELLSNDKLNILNKNKILIGFSRGVNVLTQLIYESYNNDNNYAQYINKLFCTINSIYFLDGGNGSKQNILPINENILNNFINNIIRNNFNFHIYGTNYQWSDQYRPWISLEKESFIHLLKKYNKHKKYLIHCNLYNDKELNNSIKINNQVTNTKNNSIYKHFELLRLFNVHNARFLV